jgi:hypothetical protein
MLFCLLLIALPSYLLAQTDNIRLICPLNEATIVPPPKTQLNATEPDFCVVVKSVADTAVKAVTNGKITSVEENPDEKGKWDVVFFTKFKNIDYYFWYAGLATPIVKRNQVIKEGQPLGFIKTGEKIELLMFDFETPVDPTKYLSCK